MFYLFYNQANGEIKGISPILLEDFKEYPHIQIEVPEALGFIEGTKMPNDWLVIDTQTGPKLIRNSIDIPASNPGAFTQVPNVKTINYSIPSLNITVFAGCGTIEITIPKQNIGKVLKNIPDKELTFFVTKYNDPTAILSQFTVKMDELLKNGYVTCRSPVVGSFSLYTKAAFRHYQMVSRNARWAKASRDDGGKVNTLVVYDEVLDPFAIRDGILVVHNESKRTLDVLLPGGINTALVTEGKFVNQILLTSPRDPTILIAQLPVNIGHLHEVGKITISLPQTINKEFGVSGFPVADQMSFARIK